MSPRAVWGLAGVAVLGSLGGVVGSPDHWLAPGPLIDGHAALATDCFACHAPLRGTPAERCTTCHAVDDLGRRTTTGAPIADGTAFHQDLLEQDCAACHSDHAGPRLTQRERKPFSHGLLRPEVRDRCDTCHTAPDDPTHTGVGAACGDCHAPTAWVPATFRHDHLAQEVLAACVACHPTPTDSLHQGFGAAAERCGTCHGTAGWAPAAFEHSRYFVLDRAHDATCATCHPGDDLTTYTCYGCHAHSRASIAGEHWEEGIGDFRDCVACHRSAEGEGGEGGEGGEWEDDD